MVIKPKFIWMNGKFVKWGEAKIHITAHSLHYGDAIFEGIRSYKTSKGIIIFRLDEHIERLLYSANAFEMKIKFKKNQLKNAIKRLIKINNLGNAYIRPLVYYGHKHLEVYPKNISTNTAIIALPLKNYNFKSLRLMTSKFLRIPEKSTVLGAKITGNYANSILAMHEARKKGYDEALMLDYHGFISEGPAENIFLVKSDRSEAQEIPKEFLGTENRRFSRASVEFKNSRMRVSEANSLTTDRFLSNVNLITPSSRSALHGITRDSIIKISKDLGIKAYEKKITLSEVKNADELFFCSTLAGIEPIIAVDDKKIGNGKVGEITSKIRNKFYDIVNGKNKKYKDWLTYIN